jgi:hypothetical protein
MYVSQQNARYQPSVLFIIEFAERCNVCSLRSTGESFRVSLSVFSWNVIIVWEKVNFQITF